VAGDAAIWLLGGWLVLVLVVLALYGASLLAHLVLWRVTGWYLTRKRGREGGYSDSGNSK
jgi:hypothetical protein